MKIFQYQWQITKNCILIFFRGALLYMKSHVCFTCLDHDWCKVCVCVCVCVCMYVYFFHRKGLQNKTISWLNSWLNKTINVMIEIRPAMLCRGNDSVSSTFVKPGRATRNQRQLLWFSKKLTAKVRSIVTFLLTNLGSRPATAQRRTVTKRTVTFKRTVTTLGGVL